MSNKKINDLIKELIILCKQENLIGTNVRIILDDSMEYYASFNFNEMGISIKKILEKSVKGRSSEEHLKLIKYGFNGNVRDYLLSMGEFKDVKIWTFKVKIIKWEKE